MAFIGCRVCRFFPAKKRRCDIVDDVVVVVIIIIIIVRSPSTVPEDSPNARVAGQESTVSLKMKRLIVKAFRQYYLDRCLAIGWIDGKIDGCIGNLLLRKFDFLVVVVMSVAVVLLFLLLRLELCRTTTPFVDSPDARMVRETYTVAQVIGVHNGRSRAGFFTRGIIDVDRNGRRDGPFRLGLKH